MPTVAIVEDDPKTSRLLSSLLAEIGFTCVLQCANAEMAKEKLPGLSPEIVLMDIDLPKINGIECVRHLKPRMLKTHFVMLTVYEDANSIYDALAAGAVGYLLKRDAPSNLGASLAEVIAGGSPMSSCVARKVVLSFQPARRGSPELEDLSERERQVLQLLAHGKFYKEIADLLGITHNTVHSYIRRIYEKLHVRSRMEAVAKLEPR